MKQSETNDVWRGFTAGSWRRQIDVRDYIVAHVTPYDGGPEFLAKPTLRTPPKLVERVIAQFRDAGCNAR